MSDTPTNYVVFGNYRVSRADDRNLQVDEYKTVKAKRGRYVKEARETQKWVLRGYYPNLKSAARAILGYSNEDSVDTAKDLKTLIGEIDSNARMIVEAVEKADLKTDDFEK